MAPLRIFTPKQFKKADDEYPKWADDLPLCLNEAIKSSEHAGEIIKIKIAITYTEIGRCALHELDKNYLSQTEAVTG